MTKSARRRWSRELQGEIDGLVVGEAGSVFVHGYDPPAGGKWIDSVIPGKLSALERSSGECLWTSPCEVGYGRGFGGGLGNEDDVVLLGPSNRGHRIARMKRDTGELIGAREIEAFDQAIVAGDACVTVTPGRVAGILTSEMLEVWAHSRDGERYHLVGRDGQHVYVVTTQLERKRQGVLRLDAHSGELASSWLEPTYPIVHDFIAGDGVALLLAGSRPPSRFGRGGSETLRLEAWSTRSEEEPTQLWSRVVAEDSPDDLPDVSIALDCGKLYLARGALLEVCDALTGRELGEVALPGLDERIAWQVSQGAGILAEETRVSVFEIPA
jgi:hypothetical protein